MASSEIGSSRLYGNPRMSTDSSLLYLGLIHSVLGQCRTVIDVGCGRGAYGDDSSDPNNIFDLRGDSRTVVGIDVDSRAQANPYIDRFELLTDSTEWPTAANSADLIVSDWTLEHVQDPPSFVNEVTRTLHIGGAFVARSINYYSMLSFISRCVPNDRHRSVLRLAQPARRDVDIFPAYYRMNSRKALDTLFGDHYDYSLAYRPGLEKYVQGTSQRVGSVVAAFETRLPQTLLTSFVLCAQLRYKA